MFYFINENNHVYTHYFLKKKKKNEITKTFIYRIFNKYTNNNYEMSSIIKLVDIKN